MNAKDQETFYLGAAVYLGLDDDEVDTVLAKRSLTIKENTAAECKKGIEIQFPTQIATTMSRQWERWERYMLHNKLLKPELKMLTPITKEKLLDFMKEGQIVHIFHYAGSAKNRMVEVRVVVDEDWIVVADKTPNVSPLLATGYRVDHVSLYAVLAELGNLYHDPDNPAPLTRVGERIDK